MIDPLESKSLVVASFAGDAFPDPVMQGSFTAPIDLTLRQVIFMTLPGSKNRQVVSLDPDLTPLVAGEINSVFQLTFLSDSTVPVVYSVTDLAFPLLKGQTLYWGGAGQTDWVQLIFS